MNPESYSKSRRNLEALFVLSVLLVSMYMFSRMVKKPSEPPETSALIDFVVYKSHYNASSGEITVYVDQNGTVAASDVHLFLIRDLEWNIENVEPEEFIKISYERRLDVSDLPYWEELFIEWEYLDEEGNMVKDDKILFIILSKNDVIY
ncbi:hypothetical protein KAW53_08920 [Candidatus Bathyarchaeota archaeon]|nr:hypothetical protein [Candidatus Bathyarchaeota archaeon]